MWSLTDATNSYLYNAEIYSGKIGDQAEVGQAYRVAMQMAAPIVNCGRTLYCDNFYTSPELVRDLAAVKTYCVGTVRSNKKSIPREIHGISYQDLGSSKSSFEP